MKAQNNTPPSPGIGTSRGGLRKFGIEAPWMQTNILSFLHIEPANCEQSPGVTLFEQHPGD